MVACSVCYLLIIIVINTITTNYIKSFDLIDDNEKKISQYIITQNLISLVYNATVTGLYSLCVHCFFIII